LHYLTPADLVQFDRQKNPSEHNSGIEWGHRQVYSLFSFLAELTDVEYAVIVAPDGKLDFRDPDSLSNDADSERADKWFVEDLAALRQESHGGPSGTSWYTRLASVAQTVLLNLIHVHFEFADVHGKKTIMFSEQTCRNIMIRVPTPPLPSGEYQPFFVASATIAEWVSHFEDVDPTEPLHPFIKEQRAINADRFSNMDSDSIQAASSTGEYASKQVQDALVSDFVAAGGDLSSFTADDFPNILSLRATAMLPQKLDEFAAAFANTNLYGQTSLVFARLDQEILRNQLLRKQCEKNESFLVGKRAELRQKVVAYKEARQLMNDTVASWNVVRAEVHGLEEKVNAFERNSVLKGYMDRDEAARQTHQSPFASPVTYAGYVCSYGLALTSRTQQRPVSANFIPETSSTLQHPLGPFGNFGGVSLDEIFNEPPPSHLSRSQQKDNSDATKAKQGVAPPSMKDGDVNEPFKADRVGPGAPSDGDVE
jgi:hypothetical protein